ncbi:hypothetical protein JCM11251_007774 [Rhodosporidiobolus azoricus]
MHSQDEEAERLLADSRERVEWGATFIERLESLIQTLTTLSERAAALPIPPWRLPSPPPPISSSSSLETPASAAATDSLRHTVRQLIAASRRVSSAIDRHRDSITAAATRLSEERTDASSGNMEEEHVPLLRTDVPLPVQVPSRPTSASLLTAAPLPNVLPTSPNPSGLLLPTSTGTFSFPLTASPRPISPRTPSTEQARTALIPPPAPDQDPDQENYPGESAQLLRIAQLQRDIAARTGELRDLRARTEELEREQRRESSSGVEVGMAIAEGGEEGGLEGSLVRRRIPRGEGNPWTVREEAAEEGDGEAKEEEEGEGENEWDSLQREIEEDRYGAFVRSVGSRDSGLSPSASVSRVSKEEKRRRDYEIWSMCGR